MKRIVISPADVSARIERLLQELRAGTADLDLRGKVLVLCEILKSTRDLYKAVVTEAGCTAADARGRILYYMQDNVGQVLSAEELEIVSGISDYGRRIRELRVEFGYRIITGDTADPDHDLRLRRNQYMLTRKEPDAKAAARWRIANRIRKRTGGAKDRILAFLKENVGEVVTSAELAYVGRTKEFARRVRELRTEEGYPIKTMYTGRPDLRQGEYVLEDANPRVEGRARRIDPKVEREVYARAQNRCECCHWSYTDWHPGAPRFLEIHHLVTHADGGANTAENLRVLCNKCHDEIHAGRLELDDA